MTNEILELTPEQIKEIQERFSAAAKANSEVYETELVVDFIDDSAQMVKKENK